MLFDSYLTEEEKAELRTVTIGHLFLNAIERIRVNPPSSYKETQLYNPFVRKRRKELIEALNNYNKLLDTGEFPFTQKG